MTALALVSDLETRLRLEADSLTGLDLEAALVALEDVSALVKAAARDAGLHEPWTPATVPDDVRVVVVKVALRQYRNPEGIAQENIGGAYSYTLAQGETSAYLTASEGEIVIRAVAAATGGARGRRGFTGSVRTPSAYAGPIEPDFWAWVPR